LSSLAKPAIGVTVATGFGGGGLGGRVDICLGGETSVLRSSGVDRTLGTTLAIGFVGEIG
jgi:hypothetical protein